jgi:hypothetical protein
MAGERQRTLTTVLLFAAGCTVVIGAVRAWRVMNPAADTVVRNHPRPASSPTTRPLPGLSDSDLPAYEFLLRETTKPRPHRQTPPQTQPMTLHLDAATAPTTQADAVPFPFVPQPVIPLNVARAALDYVGEDPDAELVWAYAINDPNLSPQERSDLIEDLNETGFADPQNVTPADLPLISRRLELIEYLAPDAMDETNAAAFAEAYKDLSNMYARVANELSLQQALDGGASQGSDGEPVGEPVGEPGLFPASLPPDGQ